MGLSSAIECSVLCAVPIDVCVFSAFSSIWLLAIASTPSLVPVHVHLCAPMLVHASVWSCTCVLRICLCGASFPFPSSRRLWMLRETDMLLSRVQRLKSSPRSPSSRYVQHSQRVMLMALLACCSAVAVRIPSQPCISRISIVPQCRTPNASQEHRVSLSSWLGRGRMGGLGNMGVWLGQG